MSLVAGPGRGGQSDLSKLPEDLRLHVDKHVAYIQALGNVRSHASLALMLHKNPLTLSLSGQMSSNTG